MSTVKHFIEDSLKKTSVNEFLYREFERAGYGGVDITKTPLGTNIVVYAMRPGIIIGRGGTTIKNLAIILEEKFDLPNPQISVSEIEIPELNADIMASRISQSLQRGVHFRRAGFWALRQIMDAGALGVEIVISGKLRTERARREKFREGFVPKSGEPSIVFVRKAVVHTLLKPGILGIKVYIMPPEMVFPDQASFVDQEVDEEPEKTKENPEKTLEEPEKTKEEQKETVKKSSVIKAKLEI